MIEWPAMHYVIVCLAAFFTSGLTLFSGFGLGTLLMPVFALFFPVSLAIAMTAVVHFLNNLFKLVLIGKRAQRRVVWRFGLPALGGAFLGAWVLVHLTDLPPIATYTLFAAPHAITPVKSVIALLMIGFAVLELPRFQHLAVDPRYVPLGGILSGFFGGLSGHQGALRSAFLLKTGLSKEEFIGTGVVIACLVDVTRLLVYWKQLTAGMEHRGLLIAAALSAFLGAWLGARLMPKITMRSVQILVATLLWFIAVGLGAGLL